MGSTPIAGLPFPEHVDVPDVPQDIEDLASALDSYIVPRFASATARNAAITAPQAGQLAYVTDPGSSVAPELQIYDGAAWREVTQRNLFAIKPSDEGVVASTVFQADDHLFLALKSNTRYRFDFYPFVFGNIGEDIKMRFTYPTGATMTILGGIRPATTVTGSFGEADFGAVGPDGSSPSDQINIGTPANTGSIWAAGHIFGVIQMGGTAGNLAVEWSGNTGSFTVVMKAGSFLEAWRV